MIPGAKREQRVAELKRLVERLARPDLRSALSAHDLSQLYDLVHRNLYRDCGDGLLVERRERLSDEQRELLRAIQAAVAGEVRRRWDRTQRRWALERLAKASGPPRASEPARRSPVGARPRERRARAGGRRSRASSPGRPADDDPDPVDRRGAAA